VYWPIHKFVSVLTLSRFYRPIYYGVVTNFSKWTFFIFLLAFTFISIFGAGSIVDTTFPGDSYSRLELWDDTKGYMAYTGYYDDQNQELPSKQASIPSDIITGDVLRLFVVANISNEDAMLTHMSLDSLQEVYPDTTSLALKLMIAKSFYNVYLDREPIATGSWFTHYKYHTKQRGYLSYITIDQLPEGAHLLSVKGPNDAYNYTFAEIPFYRDITFSFPNTSIQQEPEKKDKDFQPRPFGIRD